MAPTDSSVLGARGYREVGRASIMHRGKRPSASSHSLWLSSSLVRSPSFSPAASRLSVSSRACQSTAFTRSVSRPVSPRHTRASGGR